MTTGNFTEFPIPFRSGDAFIEETEALRDEVLVLKSDTDGFRAAAVTARDQAEGFKDTAEIIAAALGDEAGLPSLTGNAGLGLVVNAGADGVEWGVVAGIALIEQFDVSGTWTKDPDATWVMVEAWGAGAGGATQNGNCGGGSGGDYGRLIFRAADLTSTVAVTIGAGGPGAASGSAGNGTAGGNTTFGAFVTALGGKPGTSGGNGGAAPSAAFQNVSILDDSRCVNYGGAAGGVGGSNTTQGGSSIYGGAGGAGSRTSGSQSAAVSLYGGNGGEFTINLKGGDGEAPGGGGAAGRGSAFPGGGDGGDGRVIVRQW